MNEYGLTINPRSKWSESAKEVKVATRELEILILHSEGKSNEEIANILLDDREEDETILDVGQRKVNLYFDD